MGMLKSACMGLTALLLASGCSGGGTDEIGNTLGSARDAGRDGGETDAGSAAVLDAGEPTADGSLEQDAGEADAGALDASRSEPDADTPQPDAAVGLPPCPDPSGSELTATLQATADDYVKVFFNGQDLGFPMSGWSSQKSASVGIYLDPGKVNVIAIEAINAFAQGGPDRGAILEVAYQDPQDVTRYLVTDESWKVSDTAPPGWTNDDFDDSGWANATSLGKSGVSPWGSVLTSSDAEWLWSYLPGDVGTKPTEETRYFRKRFYMDAATGVYTDPTCLRPPR